MPTHRSNCVVCDKEIYCTSDEAIFFCANSCCYDKTRVAFCSFVHAETFRNELCEELEYRMKENSPWS